MLGKFIDAFVKQAQTMDFQPGPTGALGGALSGYYTGRSAAGTTANALSRRGYKTKNEETARNIAKVTGTAGALAGLALGLKHKDKILALARKHISSHPDMQHLYHGAIPFLAGTGGGAAAGVGTGAVTSLRGAFSRQKKEAPVKVEQQGGKALREKKASIPQLLGRLTGVSDFRRGYKAIDKAVKGGHILGSGAATSATGRRVKEVAGKAMANASGRMALTGGGLYLATRKKDGGQA